MDDSRFYKLADWMASLAEIKVVAALRDGFMMTVPFTIIGSIFLLIANLPFPGYKKMMAEMFGLDWAAPCVAVFGGTFGMLGIICCLAIAYKYTEAEDCNAFMAALLAFATFVMITPSTVTVGEGMATDVIPKLWSGSNGIITGVVVGIFAAKVSCYCEKNHIGIKMPPSVPSGVTRAFEALTPAFFTFTVGAIIFTLCDIFGDTTFPELLYQSIQSPLQGVTDSIVGGTFFSLIQTVLFWTGIHGANVVGGVLEPIMTANAMDNQALLDSGADLATDPRTHILTIQIFNTFMKPGGCGATIALIIVGLLFGKSTQIRTILKLSTPPAFFNINESIVFGLPIVFNPYMFIPFSLAMWVAMLITYFSVTLGFMHPFTAVQVPWTTPPIIGPLILQGIPGAIVQIIIIFVSCLIYLPFVKAQDNAFLKEEQGEVVKDTV